MEVTEKKVLVFGLGISGIGAGKILEQHGADVVLYDGNEKLTEDKIREQIGKDSKAQIVIGAFPEALLDGLDITILSPGVPTDLPVIDEMRRRGVQVIGEVELAYQFGKGDVLAITGTNGKTTTTSLLGEIMKKSLESNTSTPAQNSEDAKYCPTCGAKNPKNAKFCVECGTKLAQKGKCPKCGAEVSAKSKFCPECGEKLN